MGKIIALVCVLALLTVAAKYYFTRSQSKVQEPEVVQEVPVETAEVEVSDATVRTEKIGDYTWYYTVERGMAVLWRGRDEFHGEPCVDPKPDGRITVPSSVGGFPVGALGALAFYKCDKLTAIDLPHTLKRIGNRCFLWCVSLKEIRLPVFVEHIGIWAFNNCSSMQSVNLANCSDIVYDGGAFAFCPKVSQYSVHSDNKAFVADKGMLYTKDRKRLIACPAAKDGVVVVPEGVVEIGSYAFCDCSTTSVVLPKSLVKLGEGAFRNCAKLKRVEFLGDAPDLPGDVAGVFRGTGGDLKIIARANSLGWLKKGEAGLAPAWPSLTGREMVAALEREREWHDKSGKVRKVTLVGISKDGETAIFLDEKGKTVGCPLSKLADEDAACIREAADGLERLIRIGKKWKPAK